MLFFFASALALAEDYQDSMTYYSTHDLLMQAQTNTVLGGVDSQNKLSI